MTVLEKRCYYGLQLSTSEAEKRVQWVKDMRKLLSPPEMINPDGSVNQDFFKPKKVQVLLCTDCVDVLETYLGAPVTRM